MVVGGTLIGGRLVAPGGGEGGATTANEEGSEFNALNAARGQGWGWLGEEAVGET